jgi:hypothetical protein
MKHLIFSALIGCTPSKEKQKEPLHFKSAFVAEDKKKKIARILLNLRGKQVNMDYKGKIYIIYEDFTKESTTSN